MNLNRNVFKPPLMERFQVTLCRPCWFTKFMFTLCPAPWKGIQGSLGFWISRCGFQIPGNCIPVSVNGTWILDSNRLCDSGFHTVNSGFRVTGFQSLSMELGFWIPIDCVIPDSLSCILDSKNPGFQIPKAKIFQIPESGFPYLGRYVG